MQQDRPAVRLAPAIGTGPDAGKKQRAGALCARIGHLTFACNLFELFNLKARNVMSLSPQDGLIYLMVVTAAADRALSDLELSRMSDLVSRLPVFEGYDLSALPAIAADCANLLDEVGVEGVLELVIAKLPERLRDTGYALAVEIAAVDLNLEQSELRWLEMVRDALDLDRLTTAAIETAARARLRRP